MTHKNPYVQHLIDCGYDEEDAKISVAKPPREFPTTIHGRYFETKEQYDQAIHDFLNCLWNFHLDYTTQTLC